MTQSINKLTTNYILVVHEIPETVIENIKHHSRTQQIQEIKLAQFLKQTISHPKKTNNHVKWNVVFDILLLSQMCMSSLLQCGANTQVKHINSKFQSKYRIVLNKCGQWV